MTEFNTVMYNFVLDICVKLNVTNENGPQGKFCTDPVKSKAEYGLA